MKSETAVTKNYLPNATGHVPSRHWRKLRTTTSIEASLFGDGSNFEELVKTFVVYRLIVASGFIHQPNAIETVHLAVVPNPENSSGILCPWLTHITPYRNHRARGNGDWKGVLFFRLYSEWQLCSRFSLHLSPGPGYILPPSN